MDWSLISSDSLPMLEGTDISVKQIENSTEVALLMAGTFLDQGKPTQNEKVREAMKLAINADDIIENLFNGYASHSISWRIYPSTVGYDPSWTPSEHNVEKAKQLLAEAGYKSRRNSVMLVDTDSEMSVRKQYPQQERGFQEKMVYEMLTSSTLPHARILQSSPTEITLTCLPGRTLLEILEAQERSGEICHAVWNKLTRWLVDFHKITGLTMTDVNLQNFLFDEKQQILYSVDFEECEAGDIPVTAAKIDAYIRNYAPEKTPVKMEIADYVLQQFSAYLDVDINKLRMESEKQEKLLLMRRKNKHNSHKV